jgi:predicted exporter
MSRADRCALWLWGVALLATVLCVVRAHYTADLSAFLPRAPSQTQRLMVEQLNEGPASRLLLLGITAATSGTREALSRVLTAHLQRDGLFSFVSDGQAQAADTEFVFAHRYALSPGVSAQRFSAAGLRAALQDTLAQLSSPTGLLLKQLVPRDPTGETAEILTQLQGVAQPRQSNGVWVSQDGQRAVLIARTRANGSDTDAQQTAIDALRRNFAAAQAQVPNARAARLLISGTGVFAVAARETIKRQALRLSLLSTGLIVLLLLAVYRSVRALLLGLLPVASGALVGIAAVAMVFGIVHGLTLGFGITLIGEAVDYSIYLFIQSPAGQAPQLRRAAWLRSFWPTIRLGMLTSVCGFASLLPSGFPGLEQLGLFTITGLLAAALVTRFVLPPLLPAHLAIRDPQAIGAVVLKTLRRLRALRGLLLVLGIGAVALLYLHRATLWNRDLASLSPSPIGMQAVDAMLRADLGATDVSHVIVISADNLQTALRAAERADAVLKGLTDAAVIGGFETPAQYLPSIAVQRERLAALPAAAVLARNLQAATVGLPLSAARLSGFLQDAETARDSAPLQPADLTGTSFAVGFEALMIHAGERWRALLPLRGVATGTGQADIDAARVQQALMRAGIDAVVVLDLKYEADALYSGYLREITRLAAYGLLAIVVLLSLALRAVDRVLRVIAPLLLSVLVVAAALVATGHPLGLLHLVGMLLIVAVGSNYALFFDGRAAGTEPESVPRTLASLVVANAATVTGFGVLAFSSVPVLQALGVTVAPGAFLALLFAALLAPAAALPARIS